MNREREICFPSQTLHRVEKLPPFLYAAKVQHNSIGVGVTARFIPLVPAGVSTLKPTQSEEPLFPYKIQHGHSNNFQPTINGLQGGLKYHSSSGSCTVAQERGFLILKPAINKHSRRHTNNYRHIQKIYNRTCSDNTSPNAFGKILGCRQTT